MLNITGLRLKLFSIRITVATAAAESKLIDKFNKIELNI